jgi:NAD(P)H-hydrate repair Nnr-like enzyme with NAD(P)H-hydrate dehydratase domain
MADCVERAKTGDGLAGSSADRSYTKHHRVQAALRLFGESNGGQADKQGIDPKAEHRTLCPLLARALKNVTIIQKGEHDIISNGMPIPAELIEGNSTEEVLENEIQGGLKRVGGQGDILSGSTGVLMAWGSEWVKGTYA